MINIYIAALTCTSKKKTYNFNWKLKLRFSNFPRFRKTQNASESLNNIL